MADKKSLYDLSTEYKSLFERLESPDADEEALFAELEATNTELDNHLDYMAIIIKKLAVEATFYDEEQKRLATRKKTLENRVWRLKNYVRDSIINAGETKKKTALHSFSVIAGKTKLEIIDKEAAVASAFAAGYIKERKLTPDDIDKDSVKKAIENGEYLEGISTVTEPYLMIR